jgi:glucose/arabinose dehydrogenase
LLAGTAIAWAGSPGTGWAQTGYTVPSDNPYAGQPGAAPEVFAYGLRNPFRFSFDRATGDFTLGDVGQGAKEEIDFVPAGQLAGANFGWDCYEGTLKTASPCDPPGAIAPAFEYDNPPDPDTPRAVTGGYVVRDPALGSLVGRYLYGDFFVGDVRSLSLCPGCQPNDSSTGLNVSQLVAFGEDADGRLYVVSLAGPVSRLVAGVAEGTLATAPVGSFSSPMYVTSPPGDASRLFVVERSGRVQLVVDGAVQGTPFLDITGQVSTAGEQGASTIAFPPDYASSGAFYLYYSDLNGDIRMDRFHRSGSNLNVADPASQQNLLLIPHPGQTNHYGGQLQFGADGCLYVSTGDGGGSNDPPGNAQNFGSRLGKVLRIDVGTPPAQAATGCNPSASASAAAASAGAAPAGSAALDQEPPTVRVGIRRRQPVVRQRGIRGALRSNEDGRFRASGFVNLGDGAAVVFRARSLRRQVRAARRQAFRLALSRRALRRVSAGLRQRRPVAAVVRMTVRDSAGNARVLRPRRIRVIR